MSLVRVSVPQVAQSAVGIAWMQSMSPMRGRVRTGPDATALQFASKQRGFRTVVEHLGSA
jgi:hypothetical protein